MEPIKTHAANYDAVDSASAGTFPSPEVSASMPGECVAVDSASAGTFPSPEVSASMPGECDVVDSGTTPIFPSPEVSASTRGDFYSRGTQTDVLLPDISTEMYSEGTISSLSRLVVHQQLLARSRALYPKGRPTDLNSSERINTVFALFGDLLKPIETIGECGKKAILKAVGTFIGRVKKKYNDCQRHTKFFEKKNKEWLNKPFFDDLPDEIKITSPASPPSPRNANYVFLRNDDEELPAKLLKFTEPVMSSKSSSMHSSEKVKLIINTCFESPEHSEDIERSVSVPSQQPYTPEEALALIVKTNMTVDTYEFLRQDLLERGYPAFPPYHLIMGCKSLCYPKVEIQDSEFEEIEIKQNHSDED